MKFTAAILSALPLLALAAPTASPAAVTAADAIELELFKKSMLEGYGNLFKKGIQEREAEGAIEARQLFSSTRNELTAGRCADAIVIFARGTTETGNVGTVLSGPLFRAISDETNGRAIFQGVNDYPADIAGYLAGGSRSGARNMAGLVTRARSQCPSGKVFMIGYSQGAQVTHLAGDLIPTADRAAVGGVVVFGDPNRGDRFPGTLNNNVLTICDLADPICYGIPLPIGEHLNYGPDAPQAARWIAQRV
ncbi:cutinase-domain-containing protein [Tricharina praecox]|uniref:cutinase-domain-containing protein n=1 Tax=Tricharina praecox TaxID=43433 RepID=UPI00221E5D43|nr:cutinase-domain-containing protein [Tricharina praecox]KAI5857056.1 cutinase-domain-containing protein [Tricharina praecox]